MFPKLLNPGPVLAACLTSPPLGGMEGGLVKLLNLGLVLAAWVGVWLPLPFPVRLAATTLLTLFLPGWLGLQVIGLTAVTRLERIGIAFGLSYGLTSLSALGLLYAQGRLSAPALLILLGILNVALAVIIIFSRYSNRSVDSPPESGWDMSCLIIPVAGAAFFSFTNLGYSDYWGDEMNGLLRAISVIGGHPEALFEHTKGPVEVLLPAVFGLLGGRFEPFALRFPFALAHVAGVGGYYLLGRRLFGREVGLVAAGLLALNGLYLAFGRMVQYQAVFFLMTGLSILLAYYFYREGRFRYLNLSLFLVGVGLLAHYDMLLVLPPIGYLVWQRYRQAGTDWRKDGVRLAGAGLILGAVVAIFYIPFLLHPHLAKTSSYLNRIIGAANWPANNFDQLYVFAVMYNSRYYIAFIALLGSGLLLVDLFKIFQTELRNRWLWLMVTATLTLTLLAVIVGRTAFAPPLLFILLVVILVGFSKASLELKLVYGWFGISFVSYVFFIDHPRTHLQIIYPGWSLLVAVALRELGLAGQRRFPAWSDRWLAGGAVVVLGVLFGLFGGYQYLLFVDSQREYIFTYPEYKQAWYGEDDDFPFGSRRLYGAPHRLGWQMINQLYQQGELQGDWNSNDDGTNLFWYTRGARRNPCYPRYYFLSQFQQREEPEDDLPNLAQQGYVPLGQVWNRDRLQIEVYEFAPLSQQQEEMIWPEPPVYDTFMTPEDFYTWPYQEPEPVISNLRPVPAVFSPNPAALVQIAEQYGDPRIVNVQDMVALIGYDLDKSWARPGGVLLVTLYWRAEQVVNLPYKIFTHLESEAGDLVAQADSFPACGSRFTHLWPVGQVIADQHAIWLPEELPANDYRLRVGLYEPQTGLRMDLLDHLGNPQGISLELVRVALPGISQDK